MLLRSYLYDNRLQTTDRMSTIYIDCTPMRKKTEDIFKLKDAIDDDFLLSDGIERSDNGMLWPEKGRL